MRLGLGIYLCALIYKREEIVFGFLKKKKEERKDSRVLTVKIKEVVPVAKEAVNIVFDATFTYKPGQFITIIHEINGKKVRRAYSLCTTPLEDKFPAVTVKRVPGGQMSNFVNDHFKPGQEIEIMEPLGMFTTPMEKNNVRKAIFWGGGSGITPLYSLMRSILLTETFSKVALVYGNKSEPYIIFRKELKQLQETYGTKIQIIHILEEDPNGYTHHHGLPTAQMIREIADEIGFADPEHYLCGPEPMMNVVKAGLNLRGTKPERIRVESFVSTHDKHAEDAPSATESEVTILLNGEEHTIKVPMNRAILDVALDANLDMPYSCQSGLCTACRGKCLEGKISLDEAEGISQSEINSGYVLLCVGKPLTGKVKVEVG